MALAVQMLIYLVLICALIYIFQFRNGNGTITYDVEIIDQHSDRFGQSVTVNHNQVCLTSDQAKHILSQSDSNTERQEVSKQV